MLRSRRMPPTTADQRRWSVLCGLQDGQSARAVRTAHCTCRRACNQQRSRAAERKYRQTAYSRPLSTPDWKIASTKFRPTPRVSSEQCVRDTPAFTRRASIHPGETDIPPTDHFSQWFRPAPRQQCGRHED
jgi:hypothetical protein